MQVAGVDDHLADGRHDPSARVALDDLIHVDVPPTALARVDDPEDGLLPLELGDVPRGPFEPFRAARFVVRPGGRADDRAADEEVEARLAGILAAADEDVQVPPLDRERWRGERARGVVAADERVDQAAAFEALDVHLPGERPPRRGCPEGRADGRPPGVVVGLEVGDDEVGAVGGGGGCRDQGEQDGDRSHGRSPEVSGISSRHGFVGGAGVSVRPIAFLGGHGGPPH